MDSVDVKLAHLEGRVQQHTIGVTERFGHLEREVADASRMASRAHDRIDKESAAIRDAWSEEVKALRDALTELTVWRARIVGYAAGLATVAGIISGLVVQVMSAAGR